MPVVAAAVVPHSPIIVPNVAGQHASALATTRQSMERLAAEFYARQVETLIILTPHGPQVGQHLTVNVAEDYQGNLLSFGDASTQLEVSGQANLAQDLKTVAEGLQTEIRLLTEPQLDYGCVVPLTYFLPPRPTVTILPITVSQPQLQSSAALGQVLEEFFHQQRRRIGILASADFLPRDKPQPRLLPYERLVGEAIARVDPGALLATDAPSDTCGVEPTILLLAALHRVTHSGHILSFEAPLGIGLLTAQIDLPS